MAIKIMLDAGHYGNKYNKGAVEGYYESNMTWELQGYLKKELEAYGFEAGTTRADKAKDLEVYARGQKAKGCDLAIGLHSNFVDDESTKRVVIIPPMNGKGDVLAEKLGATVVKTMNLKNDKYWYHQIYKREYPGKKGIDYYGFIRGAAAAGVVGIIIEHSFHSNKEACAWLMNSANLMLLAKAEAETIAAHYGYKKKADADVLYCVQVGAYGVKANADAMLKKIKAAGFDGFIATKPKN
jgi:N-acetylmuramoyl-L-alanine amidase